MSYKDFNSLTICPNERKVNLSGLNLTELPVELFKMEKIRYLYLSNNLIKVIPDDLLNLKKLKQLDISDNPIESCPDLSGLKSLRFLLLPAGIKNPPNVNLRKVRIHIT